MAGLRVRELRKSFGKNPVIEGITFEIPEGEFWILLGPSGCGKTTVLRLIAGLEEQDSGDIYIGEREVSPLSPRERDVAMVFQSYALYPHMTVYENMAFPLRMRKAERRSIDEKVRMAARLLNIETLLQRRPRELSGGQRQRVAIGRAIVREPALFLFDEPLSNLDAKLRAFMRVELKELHRKLGATILYVTHDQVEAMTLGDRIVLLNEGRIQQVGTPEELYERPSNLFVAAFIGAPRMNLLEGRLSSDPNGLFFQSGGLSIRLEGSSGWMDYSGREVTLGIRPEAILLDRGEIPCRVEHLENLGSEKIVYLRAGAERIVSKTSPDFSRKPGEVLEFGIDPKGVHLFYEGRRV